MMDWLAREGWILVSWWGLVTLAGAAVWPLLWRALASLPDRGYLLARAAGVLLVTVIYWLLGTFGFIRADVGGLALSWLLMLGISFFALRHLPELSDKATTLRGWWREHRTAVIIGEVLFIALFLGWSMVRAHQNNLVTTEKPMDLAFTASVWRGDTFPPQDPWLSDYAISYYYMGYVMAGALSKASGVYPSLGYNVWTAMLAGLSGLTAFGVVYNLVRGRLAVTARRAAGFAVVGALMLTLMGNYMTALVDIPYFNGTASQEYLSFWDVRDRQTPRYADGFAPEVITWDYWWWFRSARVITDRNFEVVGGGTDEVINEFPSFSYLLADNHPHVMALPFLLLALGIGLSVALNKRTPTVLHTLFYGVTAGGLIFLNTWDAPVALGLVIAGEALRRRHANRGRLDTEDAWYIAAFAVSLIGLAVLVYLPFLLSFGSQLGGILPNLWHPTRFQQIFLTFGALVPLIGLFLGIEAWRGGGGLNWRAGFLTAGVVIGLILAGFFAFIILGALIPNMAGPNQQRLAQVPDLLNQILARRLEYGLTTLLLLFGLVMVGARLFGRTGGSEGAPPPPITTGFALLMVGAGLVLVLVPEWLYLRDGFSQRMNTIFKFYYQAWALFSLAAAYGLALAFSEVEGVKLRGGLRAGLAFGVVVAIGAGMLYPIYGIVSRTMDETGRSNGNAVEISLDGGPSLTNPTDYAALVCLRDMTADEDDVVVAEVSFTGSYDYFEGGIASGRVAGITGLPTVLGWQGHERQWRGLGYSLAVGFREMDIMNLYDDLRMDMAALIIDRYAIDYIVYGPAERKRYGADGELKFMDALEVACENGDTRIYRANHAQRSAFDETNQ